MAQFTHNKFLTSATDIIPFAVTKNFLSHMGFEGSSHIMGGQFAKKAGQAHKNVEVALLKTQGHMKQTAESGQSDAPSYSISDQVWLSMANLTLPYLAQKLIQKWIRPYCISMVLPNAVKLVLPVFLLIHPIVNIFQVKPYYSTLKGQSFL